MKLARYEECKVKLIRIMSKAFKGKKVELIGV
jgi:hypothetical protein